MLHPHEASLDREYHWSEWELKRRALELANLRGKATHSAQTAVAAGRRDGQTQARIGVADNVINHSGCSAWRREWYRARKWFALWKARKHQNPAHVLGKHAFLAAQEEKPVLMHVFPVADAPYMLE